MFNIHCPKQHRYILLQTMTVPTSNAQILKARHSVIGKSLIVLSIYLFNLRFCLINFQLIGLYLYNYFQSLQSLKLVWVHQQVAPKFGVNYCNFKCIQIEIRAYIQNFTCRRPGENIKLNPVLTRLNYGMFLSVVLLIVTLVKTKFKCLLGYSWLS